MRGPIFTKFCQMMQFALEVSLLLLLFQHAPKASGTKTCDFRHFRDTMHFQLTGCPDNRVPQPTASSITAYCYTELTASSLAVAATITSTHYTYPRRDGQVELASVAWLNTETVYRRTVTHLSTNPARRRVTSLTSPTALPLSQTATL